MIHEAPPVIEPMDFLGLSNQLILIEHDEELNSSDVLAEIIKGKINIIFGSSPSGYGEGVFCGCNSITLAHKIMKMLDGIDYYIIDRIDLFDLKLDRRSRGALMKAFVSMMTSQRLLSGANVIVTSGKTEYKLREIADKTHNIKTK